ncbi:DegT/DnrJ/EryC1/StrS family aminotransferase [Nibricoccus aquaticus]|nr:DegT/DnrJ/EryC1/StrS family aminotransferase [Nibricoccus aquaticus]
MVTRSTLPPLEEYLGYIRQIWDTHCLTNNGPLVRELEQRLASYLASPHIWFVTNCTAALQIAIKALNLQGEIITTPFSYVATTSAVLWESCTPVFVDIRLGDLTIDPNLIEAAITPRTRAILATHVYGFPCDVAAISDIARRHNLKVIYDAAHTFGCRLDGRALATFGDVSCLSFHATKIFHTVEGGAIVINDDASLAERIRLTRAFGHHRDDHRHLGINGKNSEFHAAMGLCNLVHLDANLARHRRQHDNYSQLLSGTSVRIPRPESVNLEYNYAYFPVLLPTESAVERSLAALAALNIYPRRYFYPSLNRISYISGHPCPVSESAAEKVLCLPMSDLVTPELQEIIIGTLVAHARAPA